MEPNESWERVDRGAVAGNGPVPVDTDDLLTPERARQAKQRSEQGIPFKLTRTGGTAYIRRFFVGDYAAIGRLPAAMQQRVLDGLAKANNAANAMRSDGHVSRDIALQNMRENEQTINAFCVAAFVRPPLIFTEADRTAPDQIVVTDIDLYDRQLVFLWGQTDNEEAAKRAAPFPDEPLADVSHRPDQSASPATVGHPGVAGSGL